MAKLNINVGASNNDKTGDKLRDAFIKVNTNFTELYSLIGSGGGSTSVTVGATPPSSPTEGSLWWNSEDGKTYIYYGDVWVDTSSAGAAGATTGDISFTSSTMYKLGGLNIGNSDLTHGATANIIIPANGGDSIQLQSLYGGVTIGTGPNNAVTNVWSFRDDASVIFPNGETLVSQPSQLYFHKENGTTRSEIVLQAGSVGFTSITPTNQSILEVGATAIGFGVNDNVWTFDYSGTINVPHLLPVTFTAVLDTAHMSAPVTALSDAPWEFEVTFAVDPNGQVETQIGNSTVHISNPGYADGKEFTFTEADHGIPGYMLTLAMVDVTQNQAGWTNNFTASIVPTYPSTIISDGAVKLTSNDNDWVFGTTGRLTLPDGESYIGSAGVRLNTTGVGIIFLQDGLHGIDISDDMGVKLYHNNAYLQFYDSKLRLPPGGTIVDSNGTNILDGLGGGGYSLPTATTTVLGGVKVDGTSITINPEGIISASGTGGGGGTYDQSLNMADNVTFARVSFPDSGLGAPTTGARSSGTKLVIWPESNIIGHADYAIGMADSVLWQTVPTPGQSFKWYGGDQLALTVSGSGRVTPAGEIWAKSGDGINGLTFSPNGTDVASYIKVDGGGNTVLDSTNNVYIKRAGSDRIAVTDTTSDLMATTDVRIQSNKGGTAKTWTFAADGNLTFPGSAHKLSTSSGLGEDILTLSCEASGSSERLTFTYYDQDKNGSSANLVSSGKVILRATTADGSTSYPWQFRNDGKMYFPNGTVQSTAYQITDAPGTSKGVSGNKAGMIAVDNGNFYYCKQNYTDGVDDIWVKTAWTSTSW